MKRFIDDPLTLVPQMIDGYLRAFGRSFEKIDRYNGIVTRKREARVSVVTGGGSGGEPWCLGMAGEGLADGVAVGNIFASPPATAVAAVAKAVYHQEGVLFIAGNHSGDVMNFELAKELAELEAGIRCDTLFVTDNLASSPSRSERSGLAGLFTVIMVAAAAAREGLALHQVKAAAARVNENMSSLSATLSLGVNPVTGLSMCDIKDGEVHYGMGVTGEPGILIGKDCSARAVSAQLIEALAADLNLSAGSEVAVCINGGGCVTVLEELLICGHVCSFLQDRRISVFDVDVQERVKVERTNSICVTLIRLDERIKQYLGASASSPLVCKHHWNRRMSG